MEYFTNKRLFNTAQSDIRECKRAYGKQYFSNSFGIAYKNKGVCFPVFRSLLNMNWLKKQSRKHYNNFNNNVIEYLKNAFYNTRQTEIRLYVFSTKPLYKIKNNRLIKCS